MSITSSVHKPLGELSSAIRSEQAAGDIFYGGAKKTLILLFILLCLPFIQLGISYYASFQMLAFLFLLILIPVRFFLYGVQRCGVILGLMILPVFFVINSEESTHDFLKALREFLCYLPLYCALKYRKEISGSIYVNDKIRYVVSSLIVSLFFFTVVQYFFLKRGVYLSLPYDYYVRNTGTLPDQLDLIYSRIRPAATYGEPSYLGFVVTSLLVVVLRGYKKSWIKHGLIGCVVLTVYFCQSASGQLAVFALLFINMLQSKAQLVTKIGVILGGLLLVLVAWLANVSTIERLANIMDKKQEASGYDRLAAPAIIASEVLLNRPFGIADSELAKFITSKRAMSREALEGAFSNGFYNLLINYGLSGLILLGLLIAPIWKDWLVVVYVLLTTSFNGAFLCFDKAAIITGSLFMAFYFSAKLNLANAN